MKVIYSYWNSKRQAWDSKPAREVGEYGIICAQEDHSRCTHGNGEGRDRVFTDVLALRGMEIQSVAFTDKHCIVRLVPRANGVK